MEADDVADDQLTGCVDLHDFPAPMEFPLEWSAGLGIPVVDEDMPSTEKIAGIFDLLVRSDVIGSRNSDDTCIQKSFRDEIRRG